MKLQLTFYKESGKYYTGGEVEVPNTLRMWDDSFINTVLDAQSIVKNPRQFNIIVDEVEGEEYPAFFKALLSIKDLKKKDLEKKPYPRFHEAVALYDEVVHDRFKWDNLSLREQELIESYIIKTSCYDAYPTVFPDSGPMTDFMEFYDKVVINYYKFLN